MSYSQNSPQPHTHTPTDRQYSDTVSMDTPQSSVGPQSLGRYSVVFPKYKNQLCYCHKRAEVLISESERNPGRLYQKCTRTRDACAYWKWCNPIGQHDRQGQRSAWPEIQKNIFHFSPRIGNILIHFSLSSLLLQTGYSVVSACVVKLRWKEKTGSKVSSRWISAWHEGVIYLLTVACCAFATGLFYRYKESFILMIVAAFMAILAIAALCFRHAYADAPGFSCPWVPVVPALTIFFNMILFSQLRFGAWVRFVILTIIMIGVYAFYGKYHARSASDETTVNEGAPEEGIR